MKQDADSPWAGGNSERGRSSTLQGCWQFAKHGQVIDMSTAAKKKLKRKRKINKKNQGKEEKSRKFVEMHMANLFSKECGEGSA